jgi:membrane-bound metal-dependent hydrolase YbcI (DUF457 family)
VTGGLFAAALYVGALAAAFSVDAAYAQFGLLELVAYPVGLVGICLMFALWPDVDTNSKGQDLFYTIFFVADLVLIAARRFEEAAYLGLFAILPILGKHRGWTHTWWAMLLVPLPLVVLPYLLAPERPLAGLPFYGAAVAGYASHLLLDGYRLRPRARRR